MKKEVLWMAILLDRVIWENSVKGGLRGEKSLKEVRR